MLSKNDYTYYIQEKYFKTGLYTHFFLDLIESPPLATDTSERVRVKWVFTFQDLGSTHTITRDFTLILINPETGEMSVDGHVCPDMTHVEDVLFKGFYHDYMRDLYTFEGINF